MKKKNIIALALVLLVIGVFILVVLLCSDPSKVPPVHKHVWEWYKGSERHYEYTTCEEHDPIIRNESGHEYTDDLDENCNLCGYVRYSSWIWTYDSEEHWQYANGHPDIKKNVASHYYDDNDDATCNERNCPYKRDIPTKDDKLDISIGDDGNATIGGVEDGITEVVLPSTVTDPSTGKDVPVTTVQDEAFKNNQSLTTIKLLDGITTISASAFEGCSNLTSISIPKTVTEIDSSAFKGCYSLEKIEVDSENPVYLSSYNCIVRKADKCVILGCKASKIPANADIATSIGSYAFYGSGLEKIAIPNNITAIGEHAFANCASLTEFTTLQALTEIKSYTFSGCIKLKTVTLHDGVTEIGDGAFDGCTSLSEITIPANLTKISNYAFRGCTAIQAIEINEGATAIGTGAFSGCTGLKSVTIPHSVKGIYPNAFNGCNRLTEIIFKGTQEEWEAIIPKEPDLPEGVTVTCTVETQPTQPDEPDNPDDGENTGDNGDNTGDGGDNSENPDETTTD